MRHFIPICILFLTFSCNNRQENAKNVLSTDNLDSLDRDTSSFITTDFPDTVKNILYNAANTLMNSILKTPHDSLTKMLGNSGFELTNSDGEITAEKKYFNRREQITWRSTKLDTITVAIRYWYLGKKYILIGQRWGN